MLGRTRPDLAEPIPLGRAAALRALMALAAVAAAGVALNRSGLPEANRWGAGLAVAVCAVALAALALGLWRRRRRHRLRTALMGWLAQDGQAAILEGEDGRVLGSNAAAATLRPEAGTPLTDALGRLVEDPHGLVQRMRAALGAGLPAREDVETRSGLTRIWATSVPGGTLWRTDRRDPKAAPAAAASALPLMTVSDSGTILWMNDSLRAAVGARARRLSDVIPGPAPEGAGAIRDVRLKDRTARMRVVASARADGRRQVFLLPVEADAMPEAEVLDALPIAVLRLDETGLIIGSNRMAKLLLPRVREAGAALSGLVEGLGRPVKAWVEEAATGRAEHRTETVRVTDSVPDLYLQVTLARAVSDEGDAAGLVAVLADATELKTMEAQFVQSQKMQAIGQLAGGVAHDFNNLLTAIAGHCDLLLMRHGADDPSHADLTQINRNAGRAAALVGQLLAFSRKQTLEMKDIDLRDTLGDLTHLLDRLVGDNVRLTLDHGAGLLPIRGDRRQLEQVLMNLVVNARDAMPDGGEVALRTVLERRDTPLVRDRATVPAGDYVVVTVSDQGVGIPPERVSRIFEPFYTTKRPGEGTGLGLSMAYGIVKQSGGFIFADSEVGVGTTFRIYFPAVAPPRAAAPAVPAAAPVACAAEAPRPAAGRTVLLVEDEAPVRAFASRALRLRGYSVVEAPDAEAALRELEGDIAVDLIVTDVMMPGMDGPTWVRKALRERPDLRTVFVSGYSEDALSDRAEPVPNSTFLPKPFSLAELTATVAEAMEA